MASGGIEAESQLGSKLTDLKCEPCCKDGNQHEAVGICVDCQDYLCKKCFECHTIPRPCRDHKLLDLQQMLLRHCPWTRLDKCGYHKGKRIKYFCLDHRKLACSVCLNVDHRPCRRVQYIPDVASDLANRRFEDEAEHVEDINVTTESDLYRCFITGSVILQDNTLAVVDYNNQSLKKVDVKHGSFVMKIRLSSHPWDITKINNQVAITLPEEKRVVFVTTEETMTVDRTLKVQGSCHGIHYSSGRLALSFTDPDNNFKNPDKVQVINLQGTVLHEIITDTMFYVPFYVTFGQDNKSLYVSACSSDKVVCVTFDGTVVAEYIMGGPRNVVCDQRGNVFVCAFDSSTIHQITPDCKKVRKLLGEADGLSRPYSISYSDTDNLLYVGMYEKNYIKVFRTFI